MQLTLSQLALLGGCGLICIVFGIGCAIADAIQRSRVAWRERMINRCL